MTAATEAEIEERLARLFDRLARMSDAELMVLRSAWEEIDPDERGRAWDGARAVIERRGRKGLVEASRRRLSVWVNDYLTATSAEYGNFLISAGSGMDAGSVRREALPPLLDAVAATVAADGITDDERSVLLEPFESLDQHD